MSSATGDPEQRRLVPEWPQVLHLVAHQLRGPLSLLAGYAEMLATEEVQRSPEHLNSILEEIRGCLGELSRLSFELEEGSRAAAASLPIRPERIPVDSLIEEVMHAAAPLCQRRNVTLESKGGDVGGYLVGDPFYLKACLLNLIDNAAKYGKQNGRVQLFTQIDHETIELEVIDEGMGLGSKASELFAPFTQGPEAKEGLGLGLTLVRAIVEAHGGSMVWGSRNGSYVGFKVPWAAN